jgi:phosphoribosylglycinamide formyltransferase-1
MNIAVFASGRGSNFQAILNAIDEGILPARIVVLISNNSDAGAMEIARARNISTEHLSQKMFSSEEVFADAMLKVLDKNHAEFIALSGYMKKIPAQVIRQYRNR